MDNNKDLGKLFKERLANAEAEPSGALWSQIEKTLDHKQKRHGFMWLWFGVVLLLSISTLVYFNTESKNLPEHKLPMEIPASKADGPQNAKTKNDDAITPRNNLGKDDSSDQNAKHKTNESGEEPFSTKSNVPSKSNPIVEKQLQPEKYNRPKNKTPNSTSPIPSRTTTDKSNVARQLQSEESMLPQKMSTLEDINLSKPNSSTEKEIVHELTNEASPKIVADDTSKNSLQKNERGSASQEQQEVTSDSIGQLPRGKPTKHSEGNSLRITGQTSEHLPAEQAGSNLDNRVKKKRLPKKTAPDEIVEEEPVWRNWLLSFQAGPNMFEHLNNRSPFESSLISGQTKLDVSYSYGLLVNVPLGEKTVLRFGYKRANLKSSTRQAISTISENGRPAILTSRAIKRNRNTIAPAFEQSLSASDVFTIDQQINYQGIPFEFLYRLKAGQLKIDALVGASAHVLGKSTLTLKNENGSLEAGSAAYLKKFAIAPTIGMTFRYQVMENFSFDIEPTFQYQLNAFENEYKNTYPLIISLTIGGTLKL